jgi:Flp pilus assembly protein TadD
VDSGEPEKAIEQLRLAVDQRPDYTDGWYQLGTILQQQGDVDGAIAALTKTVALDGTDDGAYNSLGLLLRKRGDLEGSKAAFAKAAEVRAAKLQAKEQSIREGAARISK